MDRFQLEATADRHIWDDVSDQIFNEYMEQSCIADIIEKTIHENSDTWDVPSIFQWWRVDKGFGIAALTAGEVIVETPLGTLWGRQTCGQPVYQDLNVQDIFTAMHAV